MIRTSSLQKHREQDRRAQFESRWPHVWVMHQHVAYFQQVTPRADHTCSSYNLEVVNTLTVKMYVFFTIFALWGGEEEEIKSGKTIAILTS